MRPPTGQIHLQHFAPLFWRCAAITRNEDAPREQEHVSIHSSGGDA